MQHPEQCQITACLTTGHFSYNSRKKRKQELRIPMSLQSKPHSAFSSSILTHPHKRCNKNKRSALTNHFVKPLLCEFYKALTVPVDRGHISSTTTLYLGSCWDSGSNILLCCLGFQPQTLVSNQQGPPLAKTDFTDGCHLFTSLAAGLWC